MTDYKRIFQSDETLQVLIRERPHGTYVRHSTGGELIAEFTIEGPTSIKRKIDAFVTAYEVR